MAIEDSRRLATLWSDLEAADIPLEPIENRLGVDTSNSGTGLTIRAGRPRWRSAIQELKNGRFTLTVPVFIRRDRRGKTIIRAAWIGAPWPDASIEFLDDPRHEEKHPGYYCFPDDTERFPREDVLNHRINGILAHGDIREGLILAVDLRPPEAFKDHDKVLITFGVLDQWDREHTAKIEMTMNRLTIQAKPIVRSTRGALLSRRSILPPTRSLIARHETPAERRKGEEEDYFSIFEDITRLQSKGKQAEVPIGPKVPVH